MKILLVNVVDPRDSEAIPHLGVAYVGTYLKKKGYEDVKVVSNPVDYEKEKADIVGFSCVSQNYQIAMKEAKKAKAAGAITVIGGVHITILPDTLDESMDVGVIGEGEKTFSELVSVIDNHGLDKDELSKIKGIVYWNNGSLKKTEPRPMVDNLDEFPIVDRSLLPETNMPTMVTSRGCPFKCVFCCSNNLWPTTRFRSAENVVKEIRELAEKGAKHISFTDDLFIADVKRLREIVEDLKKDGLNKKLTFTMWCKASLIRDDTVVLLKDMNTELISLGLESGNQKILEYAKQGSATVEDNTRAVNLLRDNGINVQATFVIGFPPDTRETIMDTYNYIKNSRVNSFEVYMLAPLPATLMWDVAKEKGLVNDNKDFDWETIAHRAEYDMSKKLVVCDNLTPQQLYDLHKKFVWLRKKKKLGHMMRNAVKHPYRIPRWLKSKIF